MNMQGSNRESQDIYSVVERSESGDRSRFAVNANVAQTSLAISNQTYGALVLEPTIRSRDRRSSYEDVSDIIVQRPQPSKMELDIGLLNVAEKHPPPPCSQPSSQITYVNAEVLPQKTGELTIDTTQPYIDQTEADVNEYPPYSCLKTSDKVTYVNTQVLQTIAIDQPVSLTSCFGQGKEEVGMSLPVSCLQSSNCVRYANSPETKHASNECSIISPSFVHLRSTEVKRKDPLSSTIDEDKVVPLIRFSVGLDNNSNSIQGPETLNTQLSDQVMIDDSDDDFWLNLAKGQTLQSKRTSAFATSLNNENRHSNVLTKDSSQNVQGEIVRKFSSTRHDILDTPLPRDSIKSQESENFDLFSDFTSSTDKTRSVDAVDKIPADINYEDIACEPIYELAKPIESNTNSDSNNSGDYVYLDPSKFAINNAPSVVMPKQLVRKYKSVTFRKQRPTALTDEDFKTASLDRRTRPDDCPDINRENQIYESVDNLSIRDPLPVPHLDQHLKGHRYANVHGGKKIKVYDPPWKTYNREIEEVIKPRPKSGLGLDHVYTKVNKHKCYENLPLTSLMGSDNNDLPRTVVRKSRNSQLYAEVTTAMDNEDFFREFDENRKQSNASSISGLYSTIEDLHLSQNLSNQACSHNKTLKGRSSFNPLSFIFHFQVKIASRSGVKVKKIQPKSEGQCWLLCDDDVNIRLFDPQGMEMESIHLGDQGETLAYDLQRHLYVACKNSKRIFRIDTKHLCQVSRNYIYLFI